MCARCPRDLDGQWVWPKSPYVGCGLRTVSSQRLRRFTRDFFAAMVRTASLIERILFQDSLLRERKYFHGGMSGCSGGVCLILPITQS